MTVEASSTPTTPTIPDVMPVLPLWDNVIVHPGGCSIGDCSGAIDPVN